MLESYKFLAPSRKMCFLFFFKDQDMLINNVSSDQTQFLIGLNKRWYLGLWTTFAFVACSFMPFYCSDGNDAKNVESMEVQ